MKTYLIKRFAAADQDYSDFVGAKTGGMAVRLINDMMLSKMTASEKRAVNRLRAGQSTEIAADEGAVILVLCLDIPADRHREVIVDHTMRVSLQASRLA